ncbi:MAG: adenylosuccinate synthase [Bacteroidota bacterium]
MNVDVILGLQWGDEGKGKIVDVFTPRYDVIARFQGGPNAGHTIEFDGKKFILHTIPSGIFHPEKQNVIGNGVIIDPFILFNEVDSLHAVSLEPEKNLLISRRAHLILPSHRLLDAAYEASKGKEKVGSTLKGIGPAYTDKYGRTGLRVGNLTDPGFNGCYSHLKERHLEIIRQYQFDFGNYLIDGLPFDEYEKVWLDAVKRLKVFRFIDSEYYLNECIASGKSILAEGAQGALLDIDFGSFPFVTSSNTITAGACSGLGIAPHLIGTVYGIFKAYCTRVGGGPFPTELLTEQGDLLRNAGHEFGSTTGRPRRCGWLDLPALNYAIMLNGVNRLIMMKADVLNSLENIQVCTNYKRKGILTNKLPFDLGEETLQPVYDTLPGWNASLNDCMEFETLPENLRAYTTYIEKATGLPVEILSLGPDRTQTVFRKGD